MYIFGWIAVSVVFLLVLLLIYVSWLLFSLACAKDIPKVIKPMMDNLLTGYVPEGNAEVEAGYAFYNESKRETWTVSSFDGLRLYAEFIPCENARATILLMHGYRSDPLHDFSAVLPYYNSLGLNILMCEQRAHVRSEGKYITFGVLERFDVLSWTEEINRRIGKDTPIILDGISMGASTVLFSTDTALPDNVAGFIADCGYSSAKSQIIHVMGLMKLPVYPFYPLANAVCRLIAKFSFSDSDAVSNVSKTNIPCLLIHGEADDFVPCTNVRDIYSACNGKKHLFLCPDASHGMSYLTQMDKCKKMLSDFIDEVLG